MAITMTPQEALKQCEDILVLLEDAVPEEAWLKAPAFFESVEAGAKGIQETITRLGRVSDKQLNALSNWERGVLKWIHD